MLDHVTKNAMKQLAISTGQEWEMLNRNNKALDCLFQGPQFASSKLVMDLNNGDHGGVNFRLMLTDYVLKFKGCYREAW